PLGEIGEEAGVEDRSVVRRHDPHDRPVDLAHVGVGAVHQRYFVRVQDDARTHRVDADQVDERLYDHRVVAAARVAQHLLQDLVRLDGNRLVRAPAGSGVEPVGDGDDLRVDGWAAGPDRLRIPG